MPNVGEDRRVSMQKTRKMLQLSLAALLTLAGARFFGGAVALAGPPPGDHPPDADVVVFTGAGTGTFGGHATDFRFSLSCKEASDKPNQTLCRGGSMSFDRGKLVRQMTGTLAEDAPHTDTYTATVASADGAIACTVHNTAHPVNGPHNTIVISCSKPSGTATITDGIVSDHSGGT
jgi:hypothetical protein